MERVEVWKQGEELSEIFAKCNISGSSAMLQISPDYTLLALATKGIEPDVIWQFNIGFEKTANQFFRHNPPTPGEVENAIMVVEDEVMQMSKLIPAGTHLFSSDVAVKEIYAQLISLQPIKLRIFLKKIIPLFVDNGL